MKKIIKSCLCLGLVSSCLVGCSTKSGNISITKTEKGFGGDVVVTTTFKDGKIVSIDAKGDKETPEYGGKAIEQLPKLMVDANSADVDGVTGATVTSSALKKAVADAINEAKGQSVEIPEVKMVAGEYTAQATGFSLIQPLEVTVKVSETAIESITVNDDNGETYPFLVAAKDKLIPRMIENQSVKIDAITGATGSSTGIKIATEDCLNQALAAANTDANAIQNFYKTLEKSTEKETIEVDVLVVGLGGSGSAAAMSAAETQYNLNGQDASKVSVLAIDKAGKYGGTSCITADTMGINAKGYQDEYYGGKDYVDAEAMKENWNEFTKGDAKEDLLNLFFDESGETIDWLIDHGFDYGKADEEGNGGPQRGFTEQDIYRVKFQYTGQGYGNWKKETGAMFDELMENYTNVGGKYMLELEATELLFDKDTNTVTGVKAVQYDGKEYTINAKQVIIGTGGFSNNADLQEEYLSNDYYPLKGSWLMYGMKQNDGKMIGSALQLGVGTYNIGMPPMVHLQGAPITLRDYPVELVGDGSVGFWTQKPRTNSLNDFPQALASVPYAIQVGTNGKRFANEAGVFQTWKSGPNYYTIWSEETFKEMQANGLPGAGFSDDLTCQGGIDGGKPLPELFDVVDLCIEKGIAYKADTIEELAKLINVDPTTLADTIKNYNESCANGVDTEFGKDVDNLVAIPDTGPYYAFTGASYIYSTVGGLDVNTNLQVLQNDGETPINGLYAVGTDSLGVLFSEQREYVTYGGAAQGWAYTSGRLAGIHAVETLAE
ncbi:MAG: FAD-binding protein [Erysipelotrichales bacterium]